VKGIGVSRHLRLAFACLLIASSLVVGLPLAAAAAPTTLEGLQQDLSNLLNGWDGTYAVAVTDLQTDQTISVNGSRQQEAASTIKIYVAMAVAQDIESGSLNKDDVDGLVDAMMGQSDNEATYELITMIGGGDVVAGVMRANDLMQQLGATQSVMVSPPDHPEIDLGIAWENLITAVDTNLVLAKLYHGKALSPWATSYVLQSMTLPEDWQTASVGGPLPASTTFYHKPGWLGDPDGAWNDAGIVTFQRNGQTLAYAITYLGSMTEESLAYDHGYDVSQLVWNYFDATYPLETSHFFPETGHSVANGFLRYWEQNGGLAVFGYPLTNEIQQHGTTMQYFERARFEWHPGAAPDNYDVLLGLLGNELTVNRRAAGEAPFQSVIADDACTYFAPTGHNLCAPFIDYWNDYGGLAIYGYPISEAFSEGGFTVQYFERARFEYHPENAGTPYVVLLGRLGAQELGTER